MGSQILSGSIFGDHSSPLSDTTLLSSVASGCDLFRHVVTQLPYALWVACFAVLCGTQMVGGGVNPGWCFFVGILMQTLLTFLVAAPVVAESGRFDVFTEGYLWCTLRLKGCLKRGDDGDDQTQRELEVMRRETVQFVENEEDGYFPDYLMSILTKLGIDGICGGAASMEKDGDKEMDDLASAGHVTEVKSMSVSTSGQREENMESGTDTQAQGQEQEDKE